MFSVPATPDFSTLARRPSERLAIVEYVRDTPNFQETDYLEWKSAYDLSKRPEAGATSKHLIGFANRVFRTQPAMPLATPTCFWGLRPGTCPACRRGIRRTSRTGLCVS